MFPKGTSEQDNEVVSQEGEIPNLGENAKPHWELVAEKNIIDFELGVKITGAGFPVYRGKGARMQRALINYFLDKNIEDKHKTQKYFFYYANLLDLGYWEMKC